MRQLREALIGKGNINQAESKRELYVLLVTSERTVRAVKNELKDYLYDNDYFYTWILTKSQIKEIYDKYSEIKEDRWLEIYRFRDQSSLDIMKSCPRNMEFRKIENKAGLIQMTPKEIYETILK